MLICSTPNGSEVNSILCGENKMLNKYLGIVHGGGTIVILKKEGESGVWHFGYLHPKSSALIQAGFYQSPKAGSAMTEWDHIMPNRC